MLLISKTYWLGMPFEFRDPIPDSTTVSPVQLVTADFRKIIGLLYQPDARTRRKVGVLVMHPRADFSRHYCIPALVQAGVTVLGLTTRCLNNDTTAIHEDLLLDVAAGVARLRDEGCEKVVLFGNSGGGSLFAFYQAQAELAPSARITRDPAGKPTKLAVATLQKADALIAVSAHPGEGKVLQSCIDPAVVDERDPLQSDATLDMYREENGFAPPPAESRYAPEFLARFRAGQAARVARIDAIARSLIRDAREAEQAYESSAGTLPFSERQAIGRRAAFEPVMVVYRTMANPNYTDRSLDPSPRSYGSLFSDRPDLMNFQYVGFGRITTPAAWLSTWSGLSSNADFCKNVAGITVPVLMVNALRDREIHPHDAKVMWDAVTSEDRTFLEQDAEHYFEPEFGAKTAPDVARLMERVVPWVLERFA